MEACAESLSCVRLFVTPWIVARQAPLSMGILQARILEWVLVARQVLLQGIFPTQGSNADLPHCRQILYQLSHTMEEFREGRIKSDFFGRRD